MEINGQAKAVRIGGSGRPKRVLLGSMAVVGLLMITSLALHAGIQRLPIALGPMAVGQVVSPGIPLKINHQGVVSVNGKRFDGTGEFTFALVDPDTDTSLWTSGPIIVVVDKGLYSIVLGDTSIPNMTEIPVSVFDDDNVVLRIWFDDTQGNGLQQLRPDFVLASVPYTYRAARATAADYATAADTATNADHAAAADTAITADHATTADTATMATNADHAAAADTAITADHATTADQLTDPSFLVPRGAILMWSGSIGSIPSGWALCDGTNGTPDLRDRFIVGASIDDGGIAKTTIVSPLSQTGGNASHSHSGTVGPDDSGNYRAWDAPPGTSGWNGDASRGWHTHAITTGTADSLPPYYALAYIMKN